MCYPTFRTSLFPFVRSNGSGILLVLLLFLTASSPALAQTCTGITDLECQALYALYNSTDGDNWTDNTNWLSTQPADDWYGVSVSSGHVSSISLYENGLVGEIPQELGQLTELTLLVLSSGSLSGSNVLSGSIPPEIGNLDKLQGLYLQYNNLTGSIPPELGDLDSIKYLELSQNDLTGSIPPELGNLTNLERLALAYNELTGSIPPELGNLINLRSFTFARNNLTGAIPPEIGNLGNLESIALWQNELTGPIPPEIGNLTLLQDLHLNSNNLDGALPPEIGNLSNLVQLRIEGNSISGPLPPELGNLTNLERFYGHDNEFTGPIPPELGNLVNLESLMLRSNHLTGVLPLELGNLANLTLLYLSSNALSGNLSAIFSYVPDQVNFSNNCFVASDPAMLAELETKHGNQFLNTQTIPPNNVTVETVDISGTLENRIKVSWDIIPYSTGDGGYQVFYRRAAPPAEEDSGGAPRSDPDWSPSFYYYGMTATKELTSLPVSNLEPGVEYEFLVQTVTWANGSNNYNDQISMDSATVKATTGTLSRAFIPVWKQAAEYFTGVVVSNFGPADFNLDLAAYDPDGILESLGQNPVTTTVGAGLQKSLLGWEFFQGDPYHQDLSWIELGAWSSNSMGSIFLYGVNDTRLLDGAESQSAYSSDSLYFTRPLEEGFFEGWDPDIQMCIVNPTDEEVDVGIWLRGSNKSLVMPHTIPPMGFVSGDSEDLIISNHGIADGYIEIQVTDGPGIIGFSRVEFPGVRTALGMNAVARTSVKKMYSAQLAHGLNIVTHLKLINVTGTDRSVTLTAIGDDGTQLAAPVQVQVSQRRTYSADLGTLFGLDGQGSVVTGSLVVEADGTGILGDIIFAEGDTLQYAMSLPLQDRLFTQAVFNHIANLPTVFTGFAFFNPGTAAATVLIEAIGTDGTKVAEITLVLDPGERIARTLTDPDIWPAFPTQSGGYIRIQSDQPIAGQQLFGDRSLRYMAAIPPTTRLEPMFVD